MGWAEMQDRMHQKTLAAFGQAITYMPVDGPEYAVAKAIFDKNFLAVDPNTGATVQSTNPMLKVRLADLQREPRKGDRVRVAGVLYRINEPQQDSEGGLMIELDKVGC